jgi:hypothetical protein
VAQGLAARVEPETVLEIHTPEADIQIEIPAPEAGLVAAAEEVVIEVPAPELDAWADEDTIDLAGPSFAHLGECLFERPLKKTLDDGLRRAILEAAARRSGQLPFQAEFEWHADDPVLKLKSSMLPMFAAFAPGRIAVYAKLSLAARMLVTDSNRRRAIRFIEEIADELDL